MDLQYEPSNHSVLQRRLCHISLSEAAPDPYSPGLASREYNLPVGNGSLIDFLDQQEVGCTAFCAFLDYSQILVLNT